MSHFITYSLIIVGAYILIVLLAYLLQELFLFHPEKLSRKFKFIYPVPFEEVVIQKSNGDVINGLHFPVENAKKVVFYLKGNTRSIIKGWSKFSKDFTSKCCNFFIIDYPGFGKSTGRRSEDTIYEACQLAYDWLKERYHEKDIMLYGRSFGAGIAAQLAAENTPSLLILDCPYVSLPRLAHYYTRVIPVSWLLNYKLPLDQFLNACTCQVHILHGSKDWIIPHRFSRELELNHPDIVTLHTIKGAGHNNLPNFASYHRELEEILSCSDTQSPE